MKKIYIIIIILFLSFITGCSNKDLENPYFENTTKDSLEEASLLFNQYLGRVRSQYKTYFPRNYTDREMYDEEGYINAQLFNKDVIYRHEFYNYHLSDDRSYMRYSKLYTILSTRLSNSTEHCKKVSEGESCLVTERTDHNYLLKYGITFYMEDDELYIDYMYMENDGVMSRYTFYFYENSMFNDVMEMTHHISNVDETYFEEITYIKLVFDKSLEEFVCHECGDLSDTNQGYLEYLYAAFQPQEKYVFNSRNTKTFIHFYLNDGGIHGDIFDGTTGELFNVNRGTDGIYQTNGYAQYIRNTLVVSYHLPSYYVINLNEVLGWDQLVRLPDENYKFHLVYKDEVLSDEYTVEIDFEQSEYALFTSNCCITDDVLSLIIFGLETPYNQQYFDDKFNLGNQTFEFVLLDRDLNHPYEVIYRDFLDTMNLLR